MFLYEELSGEIVDAAIQVHRELGPGLLESVYEECLCHELKTRGVPVQRQPSTTARGFKLGKVERRPDKHLRRSAFPSFTPRAVVLVCRCCIRA